MTVSILAQSGVLGTDPGDVASNSPGAELIFTVVCAGIVVLGLAAMTWHWRRTGSAFGVLMMIGALFACIVEPMVDTLGNCFFPTTHFHLFTTFGREIAWFVPFGYGLYYAIPAFAYVVAAQRGWSRREFQKLFVASFVLDLVFELSAIQGNFFIYYGEQSVSLFGLPLHWMTLNTAAAWVAAAAVYKALPYLTGWRQLAIPLLTMCLICASYYAQGWPIFSAMHAENPSQLLLLVSSLATVALGIGIIQLMITVLASSPAQLVAADDKRRAVATNA